MSANKMKQMLHLARHPRAAVVAHDICMVILAWLASSWLVERLSGTPFIANSYLLLEVGVVVGLQGVVLWATGLVQPGEAETLRFTAPSEPGDYPYVCTFPGHWIRMNGVMHVVADPESLEGCWTDRARNEDPHARSPSSAHRQGRQRGIPDIGSGPFQGLTLKRSPGP